MYAYLSHQPAKDGSTFGAPVQRHGALVDIDASRGRHGLAGLARSIAARAAHWRTSDGPMRYDLGGVEDDHVLLRQLFGRGEVSGMVLGETDVSFTESVCPGIWLVNGANDRYIEVGAMPAIVRSAAEEEPPMTMPSAATLAPGMMSALPVLFEIFAHAESWRPGDANHVISLTRLPMSPADSDFLQAVLGEGHIVIESRGYGWARAKSTRVRNVWRLRHFSASGSVVQEVIEIGGLPSAAMATDEDVRDGGQRLMDILEIYV